MDDLGRSREVDGITFRMQSLWVGNVLFRKPEEWKRAGGIEESRGYGRESGTSSVWGRGEKRKGEKLDMDRDDLGRCW